MPQPIYATNDFNKISIPTGALAITPNDSTDLTSPGILYIGSGGTLTVTVRDGNNVLFTNVPSGSFFPVNVSRVLTTGTTCTSIVALF